MTEIWKDIKELNGKYQISNLGRVKSLHYNKEKILSPGTMNNYLRVELYYNKKIYRYLIHRLVAEAFVPNLNNYKEVNHIDGNPNNNFLNNLEWCSAKQNIKHAIDLGLINNKGSKHSNAKLTEIQVIEIKKFLNKNEFTQKEIAKKFGVSAGLIQHIKFGRQWKHVKV